MKNSQLTSNKKSYSEQLLSPKWQKKRLEILQRDGFACKLCKDTETTLHIHHIYYTKGAKPWEYENEALDTLCSDCHKYIEYLTKCMGREFFNYKAILHVYKERAYGDLIIISVHKLGIDVTTFHEDDLFPEETVTYFDHTCKILLKAINSIPENVKNSPVF